MVIVGEGAALYIKTTDMERTAMLPVSAVTDLDERLTQLYEDAFPAVARLVSSMGGSFADAREVFHDAVVAWYEKERAGKIPGHVTPLAYLLGIARHLYLRRVGDDRGFEDVDELPDLHEQPVLSADEHRLLRLLQLTGQKCLSLLKAFYYDRLPAASIATMFGFGSVRSATVQKFKCLEKTRSIVQEKSLQYDDFLN